MAIGAEAKKVFGGMILRPAPRDNVGALKGKLDPADSTAVARVDQHLALDSGGYARAFLRHEYYSRRDLPNGDPDKAKGEGRQKAGPKVYSSYRR